MDFPAKLLLCFVTCLLVFGAVKAFGDNEINIEQVAQGDNLTLDLTQQGFNNDIFFSIGDGDNIDVEIVQRGHNNEIGYANDSPSWGSGVSWGGDIDYSDQDVRLWQNCTTTTCAKSDIQFHISYGMMKIK